jgi:hypothetical protein
MMSPSEEALLFNALDIVVFERLVDGSLILTGRAPGWFERICPNGRSRQYRTELTAAAPFLEEFLQQAEELWSSPQGRLHSGFWVQRDIDGYDRNLEAWALHAGARQFLILRLLGAEFEETRQALQKFRTSNLAREIRRGEANSMRRVSVPFGVWFTRCCLAVCSLAAITMFALQGFGLWHFRLGHGLMTLVGLTALVSIVGLILLTERSERTRGSR